MRRSPKLKPALWDGVVVLLVMLLAILCGAAIWGKYDQAEQMTVVVSIEGKEVKRCALEDFPVAEQVYANNGYTLKVALAEKKSSDQLGIQVNESDCPTQDCVHTGTITRSGQSIVCLPARIIIQLEGGSDANDGPDIVIG